MSEKTIWVRDRLHEQRERPQRSLDLPLKKGTIVEELDWDKKTEKVTIHKRLILERHKFFKKKEDNKNKYLSLVFKKENLVGAKKRKLKIIKQILKNQYPMLSYSFFSNFISSTQTKMEFSFMDAGKIVKLINKEMKEDSKKIRMVEKVEV